MHQRRFQISSGEPKQETFAATSEMHALDGGSLIRTLLATGVHSDDLIHELMKAGMPLRMILESLTELDPGVAQQAFECWLWGNWPHPGQGWPIVYGSLDLSGIPWVRSLPDELRIEGDLCLRGCEWLTHLPYSLHVEGNLDLRDCPNWEAKECLDQAFPGSFVCGGSILIDSQNIDGAIHNSHPDS